MHRIPSWEGTPPVNSIYISGMLTPRRLHGQKLKPRWPPMEGNFVRQFQSSTRSCTLLTRLQLLAFVWFGLKSIPNHEKSVQDEILLEQFYIIEYSEGFKNTVWPKKCAKLSKHGKLTVKWGRAFGGFLKKFIETVLSGLSLVWWCIFVKSITCRSVWFSQNIFEVLKLISIFWRNILYVFSN